MNNGSVIKLLRKGVFGDIIPPQECNEVVAIMYKYLDAALKRPESITMIINQNNVLWKANKYTVTKLLWGSHSNNTISLEDALETILKYDSLAKAHVKVIAVAPVFRAYRIQ